MVHRTGVVLRGDPRRVVAQLFLPGQEMLIEGESRASSVLDRVERLSDDEVSRALASTRLRFGDRHVNLDGILLEHFRMVEHRCANREDLTEARCLLIGAYFTREYSIESAALFNPSIVPHPDQSGLPAGDLRVILSVRAVGEGHISSIGFREGIVRASGEVEIDEPGLTAGAGYGSDYSLHRDNFLWQLEEMGGAGESDLFVLSMLPERFSYAGLEAALADLAVNRLTHEHVDEAMSRLRWIAQCNYAITFPPHSRLPERVLWPSSPTESHGMEDARFVRFSGPDGERTYYGTYTAFDGRHVVPQLIQTADFHRFRISQMSGSAAKNKGLAIFPRHIDGRYVALSRWDREANDLVLSDNCRHWDRPVTVQVPELDWELIQLGNCGSPIETKAGWLVLNHGVGPMRVYGIGALLLDRDDPTKVLGRLREPLLTPNDEEREGYVPNVVYSCGALVHDGTLVLPYGSSDASVRVATLRVDDLIGALDERVQGRGRVTPRVAPSNPGRTVASSDEVAPQRLASTSTSTER